MNECTLYVVILYVDYEEGVTVYGIYDKLAYAKKACEIAQADNIIEYGNKSWRIKEVKMNQAPVYDLLWL